MNKEEVNSLLKKLNYRGQKRIALINADNRTVKDFEGGNGGITVDTAIDPRFPYDFTVVFVKEVKEIEPLASRAMHNLTADGVLWFVFPKKNSSRIETDINPDHGWEYLTERGFDRVRKISFSAEWSAFRFRNVRFIRSARNRNS